MKRRWLLALGIGVYAASLLAHVPAKYGLHAVGIDADAFLQRVDGSLWHGSGTLELTQPVGQVEWRVRPAALFEGCFQVDVSLDVRGRGVLSHCGQGWALSDVHVGINVASALPVIGLPAQSASGHLDARLNSLTLDATGLSADGQIVWRDAVAGIGTQIVLGDVHIALQPENQHIRADVSNQDGDVDLELVVLLDRTLNYKLTGGLRAASSSVALEDLGGLGERRPDGSIGIRYVGRLQP